MKLDDRDTAATCLRRMITVYEKKLDVRVKWQPLAETLATSESNSKREREGVREKGHN